MGADKFTGPPSDGDVAPTESEVPATVVTRGACPVCGAADAAGVDGYCSACGHNSEGRDTVSILPVGASIANREIVAGRAQDDFVARAPDGREVLIVVGDAAALASEAAAAKRLQDPLFPRFMELGEDMRRGSFLALTPLPPSARPLQDVGAGMTILGAVAVLRDVLEGVRVAEAAGLAWQPDATDLYVDGTMLLSARVRVIDLIESRADASRVVAAIGRVFLPSPAVHGPVRLVRMLMVHGPDAPWPHATVDDMHAELDAVESELAAINAAPIERSQVGISCDAGLRRDHNEDAFATASGQLEGEAWTVTVVCDGVSSSSSADIASKLAAKTACDALAHFARSGDIDYEAASVAMRAAITAAHVAICAAKIERRGEKDPPGTTIVASLVYRRRLTVGWVGDSRAYWLGANGAELLTRDHSWVNEAVESGDMTEEEALRQPLAHALTRCLGPLEIGEDLRDFIAPDVRSRDLAGPGVVVLCTDGLWNYFPNAEQLAELLHGTERNAAPSAVARLLVNHALARGGGDNVTVAVYLQR